MEGTNQPIKASQGMFELQIIDSATLNIKMTVFGARQDASERADGDGGAAVTVPQSGERGMQGGSGASH